MDAHFPPSALKNMPAVDPYGDPRGYLLSLFTIAVQRAMPLHQLSAYLPSPPLHGGRTVVLGAGKAAGAMAQAMEALWPVDASLSGLVVTRYGHIPPRPKDLIERIEVLEAAHPVPDLAGMVAAERILSMAKKLTEKDTVIFLISGGGSSLLTLPVQGLSLQEKQRINECLLACGASIVEINCVRKHLSQIKGGRLALACGAAQVITLCISDVPGDDPAIIASGPTIADSSTCADALAILKRYEIAIPSATREMLETNSLETPKPVDLRFSKHQVHVIATPNQSLCAAAQFVQKSGLNAYVLSDEIQGESRDIGKMHAALGRAVANQTDSKFSAFIKPCVILSGGETTVTIKKQTPGSRRGRGGRAGEFCLGLAQALQGQTSVYAIAADTDGIDGSEDNAGAYVDPTTLRRARANAMQVDDFLDRNDAYGFFEGIGDLIVTGPTHTNVNDFRAMLIL